MRLYSLVVLMLAPLCLACIDLTGAQASLLPIGTPFVVSGTAGVVDVGGPCPIWLGENGVTYHLFQDPLLPNDQYDRITTIGVTSRLVVAKRTDLVVECAIGTILEVQEVLEIVE